MSEQQYKKIIIPLLGITLVCTLVLSAADRVTREKIADNARRHELPMLGALMPLEFDNDLFSDVLEVIEPAYFGNDHTVSVYRARKNNEPVGVVILPVVAKGYSGLIKLGAGIARDGSILSVQIIDHQETEGLGDGIDQNKSDWITQFNGRSLENSPAESWAVTSEGGQIDQLSGATISSRTVINAVRKILEFYESNSDRLY